MAALAGVLAMVCLAVAAFHLLRLVVVRVDAIGEASHAAMGVGMAAMFSPVGAPVPTVVWIGVFVLSGVWFAAVALRSAPGPGRSGAAHHVLGSGAMLFMLLGGHGGELVESGVEQAGHVGHGGGPEGDLGLTSVAAIVLAGYFAWQAIRHGGRVGGAPAPAGVSVAAGPAPATASVGAAVIGVARTRLLDDRAVGWAHAAMAAAMAVMLLGMV